MAKTHAKIQKNPEVFKEEGVPSVFEGGRNAADSFLSEAPFAPYLPVYANMLGIYSANH